MIKELLKEGIIDRKVSIKLNRKNAKDLGVIEIPIK